MSLGLFSFFEQEETLQIVLQLIIFELFTKSVLIEAERKKSSALVPLVPALLVPLVPALLEALVPPLLAALVPPLLADLVLAQLLP